MTKITITQLIELALGGIIFTATTNFGLTGFILSVIVCIPVQLIIIAIEKGKHK